MALIKQPLDISFSQGLDTKTDPFRVQVGKFLSLQNSIFDKAGRLTKRNGFGALAPLPDTTTKYLTTFNTNLTAIGSTIEAYSPSNSSWTNKGTIQSVDLSVLPAIRGSSYQSQVDAVVASNGFACIVYTDQVTSSAFTVSPSYKYAVIDSATGQNIIAPTALASADATYGTPRVFLVGGHFVILYTTHPAAYHLRYLAISTTNPTNTVGPTDVASSYIPSTTVNFDGIVVNNTLYIAYNTTAGGQSVKVITLSNALVLSAAITFSTEIATMFSLAVDNSNPSAPIIYVSYYDLVSFIGRVLAIDKNLGTVRAPTTFVTATTVLNLTSTATNGVVTLLWEVSNAYSYDGAIATNFIRSRTMTQAGVLGTAAVLVRGLGLASKGFLYGTTAYFLGIYSSTFQPSYFLINSSGKVIAKLAYQNAGPYYTAGLSNITLSGTTVVMPYLFKDLIQAVNKTQGIANSAGIYAQLGVNLVTFDFSPSAIVTSEIGQNLNLIGGFTSMYDGVSLVEQNFFIYPENVETVPHTTGGSMIDQQYFYQVIYEWADNQGNVFRSAPSIPVSSVVSGGGGNGSVTVFVPTLRLTYKTAVPVKILIYRWSTAQQSYYQMTSLTAPLLNSTTVDSVSIVDTYADATILGNDLIYTTGGVLEDLSPPASSTMTLFNNRLWLLDSEDRNLLWFSKQVIEATPVEMSDLLTMFIAPTTGAQGSTGPITALYPMDDKLVIFKKDAIYYVSGIGPDNTGANNQYTDAIFISSTVGCIDQNSLVMTPEGLMFQSDKGIWILKRDLGTTYIGAPVEDFTKTALVKTALTIPGTNQVRFTMDSGIILMYDYFYGQWGTFTNIPAVASTIYGSLHTYVNSLGQVFQETLNQYLDNSSPVLMSFTTNWMNLAGLQGYERFYYMFLLGQYITPFKLNVQIAYDYNPSSTQNVVVTPQAPSQPWGGLSVWGGGTAWGGTSPVFEARIFPQKQKCESFQITLTEVYDSSFGIQPGAGLTLSGLNLITGIKKGYRTSAAAKNFGK